MYDMKEHYQEIADTYAKRANTIDTMESGDLADMQKAIKTINDCTRMLFECGDIYLSDLHKLEAAANSLERIIDITPSEYQLEGFAEHGVKWPIKSGGK
jgi:hypothetical protein